MKFSGIYQWESLPHIIEKVLQHKHTKSTNTTASEQHTSKKKRTNKHPSTSNIQVKKKKNFSLGLPSRFGEGRRRGDLCEAIC